MDVQNSDVVSGSLQISVDVIAKIARLAALEVEGVAQVRAETLSAKNLLGKTLPKPVTVELVDGIAEITVSIAARYGCKIPAVSEKVQQSVKTAVQNMTGITVSKVNLVVVGVVMDEDDDTAEG